MADNSAHIVYFESDVASSNESNPYFVRLSGAISSDANGAMTTINDHQVALSKIQLLTDAGFLGNALTGAHDTVKLTPSQAADILPDINTTSKSAVPLYGTSQNGYVLKTYGWESNIEDFKANFYYGLKTCIFCRLNGSLSLMTCITAHTSGSTVDLSKWEIIGGISSSSVSSAPIFLEAYIPTEAPNTIVIYYDSVLDYRTITTSSISIHSYGYTGSISSVVSSGQYVTITMSSPFTSDKTVYVTYVASIASIPIVKSDGSPINSFNSKVVKNLSSVSSSTNGVTGIIDKYDSGAGVFVHATNSTITSTKSGCVFTINIPSGVQCFSANINVAASDINQGADSSGVTNYINILINSNNVGLNSGKYKLPSFDCYVIPDPSAGDASPTNTSPESVSNQSFVHFGSSNVVWRKTNMSSSNAYVIIVHSL